MSKGTSARARKMGRATTREASADALERYRTFHQKEPDAVLEVHHKMPARVGLAGTILSEMYRSDKWYKDGAEEDYKHVHDEGVSLFLPWSAGGRGLRAATLPSSAMETKELAMLGECLGFFWEDHQQQVHEWNPGGKDRWWVLCSPSGDTLYFYSEEDGFVAIAHGGGLKVEREGIDG